MKRLHSFSSLLIIGMLISGLLLGCSRESPIASEPDNQLPSSTPTSNIEIETLVTTLDDAEAQSSTPGPTPTTRPFPYIYNCEMRMEFISGPLEGKGNKFTILGEEYFDDKGDLFYPGEKTAVFYDGPKYLILHSAFQNGNVLRPLEAEFIRHYLEYWGESGTDYIQAQIDSLIGSEMEWACNGQVLFRARVKEIIRLSAIASEELWQDPIYLRQILIRHEGLVSEWVGEMDPYFMDTFYLGFCGWGPESSGDERYTYYRYLINFDMIYD
ncbi:MAG: hypothetical protein H0S79_16135 [Anaerolineaceae bacterium]|nr:hypothetical protein [Anaerolineaceae bacterium]